jgi:hypothetical protein
MPAQSRTGDRMSNGWQGLLVDDATWETGVIDHPSLCGHGQLHMEHLPTRRRFQQVKR